MEKRGLERMPLLEQSGVKKRGESERQTGKEVEEKGDKRRGM